MLAHIEPCTVLTSEQKTRSITKSQLVSQLFEVLTEETDQSLEVSAISDLAGRTP